MKIGEIISAISDLFYPRLCIRCGKALNREERYLCTSCIANIPRTNFHKNSHNLTEDTFSGNAHADRAFSWFYFSRNSSYNNLIYDLKYKGNADLAKYLGKLYAAELFTDGITMDFDIIIPVPLHPKRHKKRGYNQSTMIAEGILKVFDGEIREDILIRKSETESQTRKMRFDRWENIKDAFEVKNFDKSLLSKSILLVDDVTTTGATIAACIKTLRECGYNNISVLTLAYADNK